MQTDITEANDTCPVCGSSPIRYGIDNVNLEFLCDRAAEQKLNAAISLGRIVWDNIPTLRLTADSKAIVEGLSKVMLESVEKQVGAVLGSLKTFSETFPPLIEKLPDDLRKDFQEKFETTRMTLESEFKTLREVTPTFQSVVESIETVTERIENVTSKKMDEVKVELGGKFRKVLDELGFPPAGEVKLLTQLVASSLPVLEELLRIQKVPGEKGRRGEMELLDELNNYFPEDEYQHLGTPGETDLVALVKHDGSDLGHKVLIESKKNASGWKRDFILQVQRHMTNSRERFAILAVDVLPKGANGFFIERCSEGTIFVTSRENFKVTYGALRSVLIALYPLQSGTVDIKRLLADKRIEEAIQDAYQYEDNVKRIRQKAGRIVTNAEEITKNANVLDDHLKRCLKELQRRISEAVQEIEKESPGNSISASITKAKQ
jgi:Mg2+ and Co2+ transporter CorA